MKKVLFIWSSPVIRCVIFQFDFFFSWKNQSCSVGLKCFCSTRRKVTLESRKKKRLQGAEKRSWRHELPRSPPPPLRRSSSPSIHPVILEIDSACICVKAMNECARAKDTELISWHLTTFRGISFPWMKALSLMGQNTKSRKASALWLSPLSPPPSKAPASDSCMRKRWEFLVRRTQRAVAVILALDKSVLHVGVIFTQNARRRRRRRLSWWQSAVISRARVLPRQPPTAHKTGAQVSQG